MTEEEIKQLQEENEKLKATIQEKDDLIAKKNQDIIGVRRKYKKLNEMSEEEQANLTEEEKANKEAQDEIVEIQEKLVKQQEEDRQKEIDYRKREALKALVGDDEELSAKVLENFSNIKGSELSYTKEEIGSFMEKAFNMMGTPKPDVMRGVLNNRMGNAPAINTEGGFADSEQGKALGQALGLTSGNQE